MPQSCERPGCRAPAVVIYGYGSRGESRQVWLDGWSPESDPSAWPAGTRGALCERHGSLLTAPRGWDLVDRRESAPRLFHPRPVLVQSRPIDDSVPVSRESDSASEPQDTSAAQRRRRVADLPTPQLFADRRPESLVDTEDSSMELSFDTQDEVATTGAVSEHAPQSDLEDTLDSLLDATGPLLRRAFGKRNTGRDDASKELMRPTSRVVDESA